MLYSQEKKFLFIHIPKTAGQSIKEALSRYTFSPGAVNFICRRLGKVFPQLVPLFLYRFQTFDPHLLYREVQKLIPTYELEKCFKFCFVRNPYERIISYYNHILSHPNHAFHQRVKQWGSFEAMALRLPELNEPTQAAFVKNESGVPAMDFVGRFEELHRDFESINSRLALHMKLPWVNYSQTKSVIENFYSDNSKKNVYSIYEEDFDLFEYPHRLKG